ncbi:recombinase family protein [Mucilaginibacter sp.]|uniref:recombinase family protein n=1 Tax=Mucilaginibacter sp. TaxID=1882438 RepID=UPI003265FB88
MNNNGTLRHAEYLRKSTDDKEKQVLSLGSQRDVLDRLKKAHELRIIETVEEMMSAKRPGRPGFAKLIKQIKAGKINALVTWAPHRLSRNSVDIGELINLFDTGHLKEIVTESHVYRNNPMDIFMLGFHCLQAKFENDNKAIDVKGGMIRSAKLGIYPSRPPLGYLPDKGGIKGARKRRIDPVNFPIVRKLWEQVLSGQYTPKQVLDIATEQWGLRSKKGLKLSKSTLYQMLNNPFYYGEYRWPRNGGEWYKGIHKPMVSKAEFDRVQLLIGKTGRARPVKHYFAFGGCSLHCSVCGCAISGCEKTKYQKNGNVHTYQYYFCPKHKPGVLCKEPPVSGKSLEAQIERLLQEINISKDLHQYLMAWVRRENKKRFTEILAQNAANKLAYDVVTNKLDGLIDMRAGGLITDAQYQERAQKTQSEETRLAQLIKDADDSVSGWIETAEKMFSFAEMAVYNFKKGSAAAKRGILVSLGWNLCIKDRKLDLSGENWIVPLRHIAKRLQEELPALEPVLALENKVQVENFLNSPFMCSQLDDLRNRIIKNPQKKYFTADDI